MQIIVRDNSSVHRIIRALKNPSNREIDGQISMYYNASSRSPVGEASKLWKAVLELPENASAYYTRVSIIAQHVSGRVYKNTVYEGGGFRSTTHIRKILELINRVLRMYKKGLLKGDLVIHKTAHAGVRYHTDTWPIKLCDKGEYEHWFLTGVTANWIADMANAYDIHRAPVTDSAMPEDIDNLERWLIEVGLASVDQVKTIVNSENIGTGRWIDKMARYKKRVELINILKTSVHLNNTGASEAEGWSAYLKNYNIQRFGAWCYKNGRVYYYIGGSNPMCHDIKIHANRNNTLGGIF